MNGPLARAVLEVCTSRKIMLVTAESCTGGLLAGALTDIPGSSAVFDRGFVTYTNEAKCEMLGVNPETIAQFGAVSEQVAAQMAQGALIRSCAQIALAITGVAGPGASLRKPEGRVCFGLATKCDGHSDRQTQTVEFGALGRARVRQGATETALRLIADTVRAMKN